MTEANENKKDYHLLPQSLLKTESSKKYNLFRAITLGLLAYLIFSFIFSVLPAILDLSAEKFNPLDVVIYILHNCLIGFAIGCAISYGLQQNRYSNKTVLFIFILLCSFFAYLKYSPDFFYGCGLIFFKPVFIFLHKPIFILYLCLICLGIGGFISYEKTRYSNMFFILIILCSFLVYLVVSVGSDFDDICINLPQLCILYNCFLGLGIREAVSYEVKQKKHINKKTIFILIILCSFLAYSGFFTISYIIAPSEISMSGFWHFFLHYNLALKPDAKLYGLHCYHMDKGIDRITWFNIMDVLLDGIIWLYKTIIPVNIDISTMYIIINLQLWIVQYLITVLCAWQYIIYTCPTPPQALTKP